jgi:hypothetical protein
MFKNSDATNKATRFFQNIFSTLHRHESAAENRVWCKSVQPTPALNSGRSERRGGICFSLIYIHDAYIDLYTKCRLIINLLKPTACVMHQQVYTLKNFTFCHAIFVCFVFI